MSIRSERLVFVWLTLFFFLFLRPDSVQAQPSGLLTQSGLSFGLTISRYDYEEPELMALAGNKTGIDLAANYAFGSTWPRTSESWLLRGELRYSTGLVDYRSTSTGTLKDRSDRYLEARALLGKDFDFGSYGVLPFVGFGVRQLYNDLRGTSSTGYRGYRRENRLNYVPLGLTLKFKLPNDHQVHSTAEYLYLLRGTQIARFSDKDPLESDLSFKQGKGYGLRGQILFHTGPWSFGPTVNYWSIEASETVGGYLEPKNNTHEIGLKAAYRF